MSPSSELGERLSVGEICTLVVTIAFWSDLPWRRCPADLIGIVTLDELLDILSQALALVVAAIASGRCSHDVSCQLPSS